MKLNSTYVFGCHVMFYELAMFPELINSYVEMLEGIENPENVKFEFCFNWQQYLEEVDWAAFVESEYGVGQYRYSGVILTAFDRKFRGMFDVLYKYVPLENITARLKQNGESFYNIGAYRRDLNYNWCEKVDFVCWSETDSLWPSQTLQCIEHLHSTVKVSTPKYIANFAGRKNWDTSWDSITHPLFKQVQFQDSEEWGLINEASEKSYMSYDRMEQINNIPFNSIVVESFTKPKADGSCLVISSDLIKSGANIPHSVWLAGEDTAFCDVAKLVMGDNFVQYHFSNILRVHNRRHPNKRKFVLGEDNPRGFCDDRKGSADTKFWKLVENASKQNAASSRLQVPTIKPEDVLGKLPKHGEMLK